MAATAIQVCYNLENNEGKFDRKVKALLKIIEQLKCDKLLIIARETECRMEVRGKTIEVIPAWKWLLSRCKEKNPGFIFTLLGD